MPHLRRHIDLLAVAVHQDIGLPGQLVAQGGEFLVRIVILHHNNGAELGVLHQKAHVFHAELQDLLSRRPLAVLQDHILPEDPLLVDILKNC